MWVWFLVGAAVGAVSAVLVIRFHHRRAAARTAELEARTREAERLAFVGALASGLAHEVKNPLSTLRLNLQLLEEDLTEPQQVPASRMRARVQVLRREVERLNQVLEDYLRFARQHQLDREPTDLNQVVDELLEFVRPEALRRNVHIRQQFTPALPTMMLDETLLKQALLNLIVNAFEAMPEGGELIVQTELEDSTAVIRITDTGVGIPPEELDKVFRVYYSTKETGTGLGLPTARRIVQEHGGRLELTSEPGRGTQVVVRLPIEEPTSGEQADSAQGASVGRSGEESR